MEVSVESLNKKVKEAKAAKAVKQYGDINATLNKCVEHLAKKHDNFEVTAIKDSTYERKSDNVKIDTKIVSYTFTGADGKPAKGSHTITGFRFFRNKE